MAGAQKFALCLTRTINSECGHNLIKKAATNTLTKIDFPEGKLFYQRQLQLLVLILHMGFILPQTLKKLLLV